MKVGILKPWQSEALTRKHWSKSRKQLIRSRSKAKSFWNLTSLSASYRKPKSGTGRDYRRRSRSPRHVRHFASNGREGRKRTNAVRATNPMQYCPTRRATHPLWKFWYCTRASGQHPGRRLFVHGDNLRAHLFPTTNCNARGITSNTIGSLPISSPSTVNHIPGRDLIETLAARRNTTASASR